MIHRRILAALLMALAAAAPALSLRVASAQTSPPASAPTVPGGTLRTAIFAGGCFWCMEGPFEALDGVTDVVSGYSGGRLANPTYEDVGRGGTGHAEVVRVTYDPRKVSYPTLLDVYWRNVDPFDAGGQFCDRGDSYRSEIFVATPEERQLAEASKSALEKRFGRTIATRITGASAFYAAEDYHQDYHRRNPVRYKFYRGGCGRDARLEAVWGKEARGENLSPPPPRKR
jgi:peptide-methionine (S)-S-oxide reductase